MDPISLSSQASARLQPLRGLAPDLVAVLQQGRVLAGEVLQMFGGGSVVIGVGRHRVPADSQVELELGQRFLFQVEGSGDTLALRVLPRGPSEEPPLVRLLREHLGAQRPIGELLSDLLARLGSGPRADEPRAQRLVRELAQHVFRPGADGAALRELVSRSGLGFEAALAELSDEGPPSTRALAAALAAAWADAGSPELAAQIETVTRATLDQVTRERAVAQDPGLVLLRLGRALAAAVHEAPDPASRAALARLSDRLLAGGAEVEPELALLRGWLGLSSARAPRRWLALAASLLAGKDLKGQLLRAEHEAGADEHAALRRVLASVEAEQLLSSVRREAGLGAAVTFPIPDPDVAGGWTTVRLEHRSADDGHEPSADGGASGAQRLTVGVELSRLGPLRAEVLWTSDLLSVRVSASDASTVERLRVDLRALRDALDVPGRGVHVSVVREPPEALRLEPTLADLGLRGEDGLLDLLG